MENLTHQMSLVTTTTSDITDKVGWSGARFGGARSRPFPYEFTKRTDSYQREGGGEILVRKQKWEIECERGD